MAMLRRGKRRNEPVPKSGATWLACATIDGRLLRLDGSESLASSWSDSPRPSDDLRIRKIPFISRARLPSVKTRGTVVNCSSEGEKIQKQKAATARIKYTTARRGLYSKSPAKFSRKISRRFTATSLYPKKMKGGFMTGFDQAWLAVAKARNGEPVSPACAHFSKPFIARASPIPSISRS